MELKKVNMNGNQDIFSSNGNKKSLEIVFSKDKVSLLTVAWAGREMEKKPIL